jgi:hypothetical protein
MKYFAQLSAFFLFTFALQLVPYASRAQSPVAITYNITGSLNANALSPQAIAAAPKECVIDFNSNAASIRVVMESPNGSVNYVDRVFPLQVQAFADSTFVYGEPGAWSIGLGQFSNVNEFRVRLLNPLSPALSPAIAQGTYP